MQEQRVDVDFKRNSIHNHVIHKLPSAPLDPEEGLEYYDTTLKLAGYYNGTGWIYTGAGGEAPFFAATFGDGSALTYIINHGLNSANVIADVTIASTKKRIGCDVAYTDANNVTIGFSNVAPALNELKIVVK